MKKQIPNTSVRKISAVSGGLYKDGSKDAPYVRGMVATPHGYVRVYAQPGNLTYYDMSMIFDGYEYTQSARQCPSMRTLVRMAGRFAREIAAAEGNGPTLGQLGTHGRSRQNSEGI